MTGRFLIYKARQMNWFFPACLPEKKMTTIRTPTQINAVFQLPVQSKSQPPSSGPSAMPPAPTPIPSRPDPTPLPNE